MQSEFRTLETAIEFARICQRLPLAKHLKDQLGRSSSSIALNSMEGSAKDSGRSLSFLSHCFPAHFEAVILWIAEIQHPKIVELTGRLAAQITKLCKSQP